MSTNEYTSGQLKLPFGLVLVHGLLIRKFWKKNTNPNGENQD